MSKWLGMLLLLVAHPAPGAIAQTQLETSLNSGMKGALGDNPLTSAQQVVVDNYRSQLLTLLREQLDWARFEPEAIDAYASTFAGQAMIEKMPGLIPRPQLLQREMVEKLKETASTSDSPKH